MENKRYRFMSICPQCGTPTTVDDVKVKTRNEGYYFYCTVCGYNDYLSYDKVHLIEDDSVEVEADSDPCTFLELSNVLGTDKYESLLVYLIDRIDDELEETQAKEKKLLEEKEYIAKLRDEYSNSKQNK